jgi:hypothetical protein
VFDLLLRVAITLNAGFITTVKTGSSHSLRNDFISLKTGLKAFFILSEGFYHAKDAVKLFAAQ